MIAPAGSLGDHFWNYQIRWQFGTWTSLVRSITTVSGEWREKAVLPTPRFTRPIGLLWNPLPRVKKLLGGWPKIGLLFICLPAAALFSSNLPVLKLSNTLTVWDLNESSTQHNDGKWWMARKTVLIVTLWKTRNTSSSKSTELKWSLMHKITVEMSPLNVRTHRTEGYDDTRVR